ncbi:hypothetical protein [Snodgrassella communis]|nr:hypothetical protein [Snodgrassella communis]
MSILLKIYAHNGALYYRPLKIITPEPVNYFPFTAAQYDTNNIWTDQISGRSLTGSENHIATGVYRIKNFDDGLLLNSYRTDTEIPLLRNYDYTLPAALLYGCALTIRIKPGQFEDYPMALCVLYGENGEYNRNEKLVIAIEQRQLVVFYCAKGESNPERIETGVSLNPQHQWTSIGLNFHNNKGYGLASVYISNYLMSLNIMRLKQFSGIYLFGFVSGDEEQYEDKVIATFNGAIAHAKLFNTPLIQAEFKAILDSYDDSINNGVVFTQFEHKTELMEMFLDVKNNEEDDKDNNPPPPPPDGNTGSNGNTGNSGTRPPLQPPGGNTGIIETNPPPPDGNIGNGEQLPPNQPPSGNTGASGTRPPLQPPGGSKG